MVSFARVGFSVSTALFTGDSLRHAWVGPGGLVGAARVASLGIRARCTDRQEYLRQCCPAKSGRPDGMLLEVLDQGYRVGRAQPERLRARQVRHSSLFGLALDPVTAH